MNGLLRLLTSRRARNALRTRRILAAGPQYLDLQGGEFDQAVIATVAFNRADIIEWQIHLVRKHLAECSGYVVFDNSSRPEMRNAIQEICRREKVPYVSLPRIRFKMSNSHGAALNWITQNFVARHRPALFGFIDHDIFPLEPVSIAEKMGGAKVYGRQVIRQDAWYMWGGFSFFSGIPTDTLDFDPVKFPHVFLDTGGSNWEVLYRHLRDDEVKVAGVRSAATTRKGRAFDEIDGWLHAGNAGWTPDVFAKDRRSLLEERLRSAYGGEAPAISLDLI